MTVDARVEQLLDELLDSHLTPESVCGSCPELLPQVRERWRQMCQAREELDALFPPMSDQETGSAEFSPKDTTLPEIPGYEVEAVLGVGGMGVVFRARHVRLNRIVALKMAIGGAYAGQRERARFQREAEAIAALAHPNIVQIHDVGDSDGRPFFTMEFVEGGSLSRKLAGTPLPARQAAALVATVAEAVHAAHQSGIVHRDLKPGNILLTADGIPKVTDFGLARRLQSERDLTLTGTRIGTPSYMAPEQAEGDSPDIGPAVDIYALGAIHYELMTGRPPFRAETAAETLRQVVAKDPVHPSRLNASVPRDAETICLKCLEKDPQRRYASALALAEDLRRFEMNEPIAARPTGHVERLLRRIRRKPMAAGLLAAVLLLVLVTGVGAGLQYRQWAVARERQAQTDRDVRGVLEWARNPLMEGWAAQDLVKLTAALAEANRAVDVARTGAASAIVRQEAEAFRLDADNRLKLAKKNDALRMAALDVIGQRDGSDKPSRVAGQSQLSVDEQYGAAFRRWGLDVDGMDEAVVVARLREVPDTVIPELVAALDNWMLERRRTKHPEAEWRRLFRVANQLDRSEQHRWLRKLLIGESPSRAASVAALVATGLSLPTLWQLTRGDDCQRLLEMRREIDLRSAPVLTLVLLSEAYETVGDAAEAERMLREAVTVRPNQVVLLYTLGMLLDSQGPSRRGNAIEFLRAVRAQRPSLGIALSAALIHDRRAEEAEGVLRDLIRQQQATPSLYNNLGVCLEEQEKHTEADAAYRKAIDLAPDFANAYGNLGMSLCKQGNFEAAEQACRKAIDLRPGWADFYLYLGDTLARQKNQVAAEREFRKAIAIRPDYADAYYNLGNALSNQGKHGAAAEAYRKAIALQPYFAKAHNNLGMALVQQQKPGAEAAFRKAIDLRPEFPEAQNNLGMMLENQQRYAEAEAAFRNAIALRPNFPIALFNLGNALLKQGRFDEAVTFVTTGNNLLPADHPLRKEAEPLLKDCQRYSALDARLPAILRGIAKPSNPAEQIEFAEICLLKKLNSTAANFYRHAFTAEPKIAQDVPKAARYAAACAAGLAGCGQGRDADSLDKKERAQWRQQARDWLREDLAWWTKALGKGNAQNKSDVLQRLTYWQSDKDLAGLREPSALELMSPAERNDCLALWQEVADLRKRVQLAK